MTVYTARRQSLVLKRLRTSELTDAGVITAVTMPVVTMGAVQVLVYIVFCLVVGAPTTEHPWLLLLGLASGVMLPLIGPADLVAKGWSGLDAGATLSSVPALAPGLVSIVLWAVVFAAVIARFFRWEPRA
ncbi:hypothetical protein [Lentzea cavernae]|nr:hypothetical protein [Lentzea cavernae]